MLPSEELVSPAPCRAGARGSELSSQRGPVNGHPGPAGPTGQELQTQGEPLGAGPRGVPCVFGASPAEAQHGDALCRPPPQPTPEV